jgi:hypothetical protein
MPDDEPDQPMNLKTAIILIAIFSVPIIFNLVTSKFIWGDSWEHEIILSLIVFGFMAAIIIFFYFKSRKK